MWMLKEGKRSIDGTSRLSSSLTTLKTESSVSARPLHVTGSSPALRHQLRSTKKRTYLNLSPTAPNTHKMSARPPTAPSALKQIWLKWKTLRLPWRRQFLAGADLSGNTFWEFKDAMNAQRFRRIVKYGRNTHYGDVKISRK